MTQPVIKIEARKFIIKFYSKSIKFTRESEYKILIPTAYEEEIDYQAELR